MSYATWILRLTLLGILVLPPTWCLVCESHVSSGDFDPENTTCRGMFSLLNLFYKNKAYKNMLRTF